MNAKSLIARAGITCVLGSYLIAIEAFAQDKCRAEQNAITCYETELRSLGAVRGKLTADAANAKVLIQQKEALIQQKDLQIESLRSQLQSQAAALPNSAYNFLAGTWCDTENQLLKYEHYIGKAGGKDILMVKTNREIVAAFLLPAPANQWESEGMVPPAPGFPAATINIKGTRLDDSRLQYSRKITPLGPMPFGAPFPQSTTGILVKCY